MRGPSMALWGDSALFDSGQHLLDPRFPRAATLIPSSATVSRITLLRISLPKNCFFIFLIPNHFSKMSQTPRNAKSSHPDGSQPASRPNPVVDAPSANTNATNRVTRANRQRAGVLDPVDLDNSMDLTDGLTLGIASRESLVVFDFGHDHDGPADDAVPSSTVEEKQLTPPQFSDMTITFGLYTPEASTGPVKPNHKRKWVQHKFPVTKQQIDITNSSLAQLKSHL
ncbi:uncharacterized protein MELLADRAFT_77052, partial [Melampsora larici-populina 98AG31]